MVCFIREHVFIPLIVQIHDRDYIQLVYYNCQWTIYARKVPVSN